MNQLLSTPQETEEHNLPSRQSPAPKPASRSTRKKLGLLLFGATTLLALLVLVMAGWSTVAARGLRQSVPTLPPVNVLPNGVAAGDVTQDSAVLWARSSFPAVVTFTYGITPTGPMMAMTQTVANAAIPAKVAVSGLMANARYVYTATTSDGQLGVGYFHTPADVGTSTGLRFGASGDWRGELRPYPAIANGKDRDLDLFLKLGDTIYADVKSPAVAVTQTTTITDFRKKYNEVYGLRYSRNIWADVHSNSSLLVVMDDHEVTNDYAGGADVSSDARFTDTSGLINDSTLYETGLEAFIDYNPINSTVYTDTGDPRTANEQKLYRYRTYGSDAAFFVVDARSFRDQAIAPYDATNPLTDGLRFLNQSFQAGRTLLGAAQLAELKADLLDAQAKGITWKFVAIPEPIQNLGPAGGQDRYEGYAAERTELLKFINDNGLTNVVFVAADVHGTVVNNLTYQDAPFQSHTATNAFEVTTGAVAYDAPFGPTVVETARDLGLLTPVSYTQYLSLPVSSDLDSIPNDRDDFIKAVLNEQLANSALNYDPVGLDGSPIQAELLQGDYMAVHTYGWTEFEIAPETQVLTVTTYGIDAYTEDDLFLTPTDVLTRTPRIVSQFRVVPGGGVSKTYLPLIQKEFSSAGAETSLQFNAATVVSCERQPAGNWFNGYAHLNGEPANGYQVVFSIEPDGDWATAPVITGPHAGYEGWAPGYYSHIIRAVGPIADDWYVWIVDGGGERISEIAQWTSTGPGEDCNQAQVDFAGAVSR